MIYEKNFSKEVNNFFSKYWLLLLLIATKLILQFVLVNPVYELHRDEFLHLDQAFHPSAGYVTVPPFTSWISNIIYLFGGGFFWIRFYPAFFGSLTIVFIWFIVDELGGKYYAKLLAATTYIFSVFARMHVLFQPNAFDYLIWTGLFFYLIKYIKTQQLKWLMIFAVLTSLGIYNKYTTVFLVGGLVTGLFISSQRHVLNKKGVFMPILLCIVLLLPNIYWQISNHFRVIHHMKALNSSQLVYINRIDFLFDQVKYGLVGITTIAAFIALFFFKPFKPYRFIGFSFLAVLFMYFISRAKNYYAFGLYPVLFALGSAYLEAVFKKWNRLLFPSLIFVTVFVFIFSAKLMMPVLSPAEIKANPSIFEKMGLLRWEDGSNHDLPQDFADMIGWKEMAEKSLEAFRMIPENELNNTLIFCENYGQAGALNYYNRGRMPEAYSLIGDYIYWLPKLKKIDNILYVGNQPDPEMVNMFNELKQTGIIENEFSREKGTQVFLLLGATPDFTGKFYKMVKERKSNNNFL